MTPRVLVFTHRGDHTVPEWVVASLHQRGAHAERLDLDAYPTALDLALTAGPGAGTPRLGDVPLASIQAAWLRKLGPPLLPPGLPEAAREPFRRERASHLRGLFDALEAGGTRLVNAFDAERAIEGNKPRQLRLAESVGLRVPATLVTNDADRVRAFYAAHDGEVVVKMLAELSWSMTGAPTVPTQVLRPEDLDHLASLRSGPMCFQERIRAPRELRVCWVAGRCFAGAQRMGAEVDWRVSGSGWEAATVPRDTAARLDRFMARAGLAIGSIDLMLPEDGPPVFLEVNPGGEWGMLQLFLGHDVSGAIADALLERT